MGKIIRYFTQVKSSVADPELKDADTDPTFNVDADPDPNFIYMRKENVFFKTSTYFS